MSKYSIKDDKGESVKIITHSTGKYIRMDDLIRWLKLNQKNLFNDAEVFHIIIKALVRLKNDN